MERNQARQRATLECARAAYGLVFFLHATHNTFVQGLFDPLTAPVGWAKYITTEFGAGLAVAIVVAGIVIVSTGRSRKGFSLAPRDEPR